MTSVDERDAVEEFWQIEAARFFSLSEWLIRIAETTYDRRGGNDVDKWDLNGPLRLAIEKTRAELAERCLDQDWPAVYAGGDATVARLANAVAMRLGEQVHSYWGPEGLAALAERAMK